MSDVDIKRLESIGIGYISVQVNDQVFWDLPVRGRDGSGKGIKRVAGDEVVLYKDG